MGWAKVGSILLASAVARPSLGVSGQRDGDDPGVDQIPAFVVGGWSFQAQGRISRMSSAQSPHGWPALGRVVMAELEESWFRFC
jgi:hypothetical protein